MVVTVAKDNYLHQNNLKGRYTYSDLLRALKIVFKEFKRDFDAELKKKPKVAPKAKAVQPKKDKPAAPQKAPVAPVQEEAKAPQPKKGKEGLKKENGSQ